MAVPKDLKQLKVSRRYHTAYGQNAGGEADDIGIDLGDPFPMEQKAQCEQRRPASVAVPVVRPAAVHSGLARVAPAEPLGRRPLGGVQMEVFQPQITAGPQSF